MTRRPLLRPRPTVATREAALGVGGAEDEQTHPGGQALARVHARVGDDALVVAADAGDGAADHAAVGQRDADVDGAEVACRPEQRLGGADDVLDLGQDRLDHRQPEDARRQGAAGDLGQGRGARVDAGQARAQETVADAPLLEVVELDREAVLDLVGVVGDADAEALAQERADGVLDEADEVVELDHRACRRGERRVQERAGRVALAGERPRRPARATSSKLQRWRP